MEIEITPKTVLVSMGVLVPLAVAVITFLPKPSEQATRSRQPDEARAPKRSHQDPRLSQLDRRFSRLERRIEDQREQDIDTAPEEEPEPEISAAEAREVRAQRRAEFLQELQDKIDTEPRDDQWAPEMEAKFQEIPDLSGLGSRLVSVKCASSICLAEFGHDDGKSQRDLEPELHVPDFSENFKRARVQWEGNDEDGNLKTMLYAVRR